jgi:hypothetical protein
MSPGRLRAGLVGGVMGSIIGMLGSLWWPPGPTFGTAAFFGAGTSIGLVLGLTLGTSAMEWIAALVDALVGRRSGVLLAEKHGRRPRSRSVRA